MIGATSLLLGCKYEEIYVPEITDFVYLSDNAFTKDEVKSCLVDVFRTNNFSLSRPFSLTFLRRFSKVFSVSNFLFTNSKQGSPENNFFIVRAYKVFNTYNQFTGGNLQNQ